MEETITISGKPLFILESTELGLFHLVKDITFKGKSWEWSVAENADGGDIELNVGSDIIESPNRNISILVRSLTNSRLIIDTADELKKHAEIGGYDYVSYEEIGNQFADYIGKQGEWRLYEVKPRYFRKVPLDDL